MSNIKYGFFFKDWVEFYGRARLADELKLVKATVDKWAQGKTIPEVKYMREIRKISKGHVDYIHIIENAEIKINAGETLEA